MILSVTCAALAGVLTWTFAEYALHNWVGHLAKGKNEFSRQHLAHHKDTDWFASTGSKALVAVPVTAAFWALACLALGVIHGSAFGAGFATFYLAYEILHRRTHTHAPIGFYGRWARKHHLHHHFCNPKANHGVTSPIWDIVFGTYEKPSVIAIPPKQEKGVQWLLEPETGALRERYAGDYRLHRRATA